MNSSYLSIDYIIIYTFLIITLIIGLRAGRDIKDMKDYVLGGRSFGTIALAITYLATNIAGNSVMGIINIIHSNGIIITIALLSLAIAFFIRAFFIAPSFVYFKDCLTMGDIMAKLYGRYSGIITGILGFFTAICIAGMELLVLGEFGEQLTGIKSHYIIIASGLLLALYCTYGGIKSVTATDVFQFAVLFGFLPFITSKVIAKIGSIREVFMQVPTEKLQVFSSPKFSYYAVLFIMWALFQYGTMDPALIQRMLMGNSKRQLRNKFLIIAVFDPMFQLTIMLIGLSACIIYPNLEGVRIVPQLIKDVFPVGLKGIVVSGILGICMSTIDSYLHATGVTFIHDVIRPIFRNNESVKRNELTLTKIATVTLSLVAIVIAIKSNSAFGLLMESLAFTEPLLMFPMFSGIMGLKSNKKAFYIAGIFTVISFVLTRVFIPEDISHFSILIHAGVNIIVFMAAHLIMNEGILLENRGRTHTFTGMPRGVKAVILSFIPSPGKIIRRLENRVTKYGAPYIPFGIFFVFHLTFPYFIGIFDSSKETDLGSFLRLGGIFLCSLLVAKDKWTGVFERYLPTFWYFTVIYCLPFLSTVMFFINGGSMEWTINIFTTIIILMLILDWKSFAVITSVGGLLGVVFCLSVFKGFTFSLNFDSKYILVYQTMIAISIGFLLIAIKEEKIDKMEDLRKRLELIQVSIEGRLVKELTQPNRLRNLLGQEGVDLVTGIDEFKEDIHNLLETADRENIKLAEDKVRNLLDYFKEMVNHLKSYMRLNVNHVRLIDLFDKAFAMARLPYDVESVSFIKRDDYGIRCDVDKITKLLSNSIAAIYNASPEYVINIFTEDTKLGYKLESIRTFVKQIDAIRITVTTEQKPLPLEALYTANLYNAVDTLPISSDSLPKLENESIVKAHYGCYNEMYNVVEIVLPVDVRDIRPKKLDTDDMDEFNEDPIIDYPDYEKVENDFLMKVKEKAPDVDLAEINKAMLFMKKYHKDQTRKSGEPYYFHPITVADILLDYTQDQDTIIAALLHDVVEDTRVTIIQLKTIFNATVGELVAAVSKLDKNNRVISDSESLNNLAHATDPRALYIKIADRIHNMRTIRWHSMSKQRLISKETMTFFVPLAAKLKLNKAVEELVNNCFNVLYKLYYSEKQG